MQSFYLSSRRMLFFVLAVFCFASNCGSASFASAFSFSEIVSKQATRQNNINAAATKLGLTTTTTAGAIAEEDALNIYKKAREYAFRDDFSDDGGANEYDQHYHPLSDEEAEIEEAKYWLKEIVRLQSCCAAETIAGPEVCENQDQAAEIVAQLRRKIEIHEQRLVAVRTKKSDSVVPTIATELILGALFVVVGIFWTTLDLGDRHDDLPSMSNYQTWLGILKEKGGYL